jgi:CRP-like cAMP-binding protein
MSDGPPGAAGGNAEEGIVDPGRPEGSPKGAEHIHAHVKRKELEVRRLHAGQYVFRERETGEQAYIVQSGTIELAKTTAGGEVVIDRLGKGAIFGEFSLIDGGLRMMSARAVEEGVSIVVIPRDLFLGKMEAADPFIRGLVQVLTSNVRALVDKLS